MIKLAKIFIGVAVILSACITDTQKTEDLSKEQLSVNQSDFALETKWELEGFKMPESVFSSPDHDWLYVSNVNGAEAGFISRVAKNGTIDKLEWITGLIAPTGSDLYENKLFVADVKKLHEIDVNKGTLVKSYSSDEAISLNDVTIHKKTGQVFISDVPGGKIYTLEEGNIVLWLASEEIPFPNGLYIQNDNLIVANYCKKTEEGLQRPQWKTDDFGSLYKVDISSKKVELIASSDKKGVFDGVTQINDILLASSNPMGQLFSFENGKSHLVDSSSKGIADINTDGETIYAPYLFNNKLIAYKMENWKRINTKEEYLENAAGQFFGEEAGMSIATVDGRIMGNFGGQILSGTWEWEDGFFCRTSKLGDMDLGADCILIEVTPDKMRLTLAKGTGAQVVYDRMTEEKIQALNQINIFTSFDLKPSHADQFMEAMTENVDLVRAEPGNAEMRFFVDRAKATNIFLIGRNKDQDQLNAHLKELEKRGIAEKQAPASNTPPVVRFLEPIYSLNGNYTKYIDPTKPPYVAFSLLEVKPEMGKEFLINMKEQVKLSREEEGNLIFDFYKIKDKESSYVVHGEWKDLSAFNTHVEETHTKKIASFFEHALAGESGNPLYQVEEVNSMND